jgi:hypothetical protein
MAYTEINNLNSPNFTAGRGGKKISGITIHHWGDPAQNPSAEGVVNWLCNPKSQVSAHYVATGTGRRVWCLVNDTDTAWHAGSWTGNQTTLGIECDPRCRPEDYDVVAELVADMWRYYGKLPLYPHKFWKATACPGNYVIEHIVNLAEEKLNPKPAPTPAPVPVEPQWASKPITLRVKNRTSIIDLTTMKPTGAPLEVGTDVVFATSKVVNGVEYLRSKWATDNNKNWGVVATDLMEIPVPPVVPPKVEQPPVAEMPDYSQENNKLLKQILELLQGLIAKITGIFK